MKCKPGQKSTRKRQSCAALCLLTLAVSMTACGTCAPKPITASCAVPAVTPCQPPPPPGNLETERDLALAYIEALAAYARCAAEVARIIDYYRMLEDFWNEDTGRNNSGLPAEAVR